MLSAFSVSTYTPAGVFLIVEYIMLKWVNLLCLNLARMFFLSASIFDKKYSLTRTRLHSVLVYIKRSPYISFSTFAVNLVKNDFLLHFRFIDLSLHNLGTVECFDRYSVDNCSVHRLRLASVT